MRKYLRPRFVFKKVRDSKRLYQKNFDKSLEKWNEFDIKPTNSILDRLLFISKGTIQLNRWKFFVRFPNELTFWLISKFQKKNQKKMVFESLIFVENMLSCINQGFCSTATLYNIKLKRFQCYVMQSFYDTALAYVDIVNQPIMLCQLASSINPHYKKQRICNRTIIYISVRIQPTGLPFKPSSRAITANNNKLS